MGRRFEGRVQQGYGVGAQLMSDPVIMAGLARHFTDFTPIPGTLNVMLAEPFDVRQMTGVFTAADLGHHTEDHRFARVRIAGKIPGLVIQTLNPSGDFPRELVELIADRHLRTTLELSDGDLIAFELI